MRRFVSPILLILIGAFVIVAGKGQEETAGTIGQTGEKAQTATTRQAPSLSPLDVNDQVDPALNAEAVAPSYNLDWWSINNGGEIDVASANYRLGLSVGQSVAGKVASANYGLGIGFWYGLAGGAVACPIVLTGDVNLDGPITSADIIYLVGYVFKGGPAPKPCEAAGDVNCDGTVTSADIIYLVGYVFKGGPAPCDVCTLIPGTWTCP